jgi:hypothetical protein
MVLGYGYGVLLSMRSRHCEAAGAVDAVFFVHREKKGSVNLLLSSRDSNQRCRRVLDEPGSGSDWACIGNRSDTGCNSLSATPDGGKEWNVVLIPRIEGRIRRGFRNRAGASDRGGRSCLVERQLDHSPCWFDNNDHPDHIMPNPQLYTEHEHPTRVLVQLLEGYEVEPSAFQPLPPSQVA